MLKKILFVCFVSFGYFTINAQKISGKVYTQNSLRPIEKVAIATNLKTGAVSNSQGKFILNLKNVKELTFSYLGYETKTIFVDDFKKQNFTVYLKEAVNLLDEIALNIAKISLDSLLIKTANNMKSSFISGAVRNKFYAREYTKVDFLKLDLALDKSTLLNRKTKKLAEKELNTYANKLKTSSPEFSSEFTGILRSKKVFNEKLKRDVAVNNLDSVKGITFFNNTENMTIKKAQNNLQNIVLKYLDVDKSYKLSSGIFPMEDSLSLKEIIQETDSIRADSTYFATSPKMYYDDAMKSAMFYNKKKQRNFFDTKYYEHRLEKPEFLGSNLVYVIKFTPRKSKSKFSGHIFINPKDYTIAKIKYQFAEGKKGQSLNLKWLLGVKFSEGLKKVVMYYEKNKDNQLYLSYYKQNTGAYAYVHRPLKFKENSKKKHKVKFDIKIEVDTKSSIEILLTHTFNIDENSIKPTEKDAIGKRKAYISKEEYALTDWKNRQLVFAYLKGKE